MLPAFSFDGEEHTDIRVSEQQLEIRYQGFLCRYTTNGKIIDLGEVGYNRNGHYRGFAAIGNKEIEIKIEFEKE
jgi:glutamate synthase domain-containing protein 3